MHTILKSKVEQAGIENIQSEINIFANEYRLWLAHMAQVNNPENQKLEDGNIKKHVAYPPPSSHELIMGAVDKVGNVSYEFVDDTVLVSKQTIDGRRNELFAAITQIENEEIAKIIPAGKARLWNMKENDINQRDNEARIVVQRDYYERGEELDLLKLDNYINKQRSQEDTIFLETLKELKAEVKKIQYWAAQMHSDIEDLTAEEIFEWKVPSYQA